MRKYVACVLVAAAATLVGIPLVAGAQARQIEHAKHGTKDFISISRHGNRQHVSYFVQRSHRSTNARIASCMAGQLTASYCTPPVQQNLFGAYSWGNGGVTFGSQSTSTCQALGYPSSPCGVYTAAANTLIVAFVGAAGPSGTQSITVHCTLANGTAAGGPCPVTFHKVNAENGGGGDSEVWYADATGVISQTKPIFVTATAANASCGSKGKSPCDVSLQAVTFTNAITAGATGVQATGIGASSACFSKSAAPSCSVTTTEPDSQVWAAINNPLDETIPTWPSNQFAVGVSDSANEQTFYSQFLGTCAANGNGTKPCTTMPLPASGLYLNPFKLAPTATPALGTTVKINDTAPANNPFNMVDVEIL